MKRLFDVAASLAGLLLGGWLILGLALAIRRETTGPGILAQPRIGQGGRVFVCYKLRTMHQGTVVAASHETPAAAVTPLGAKLRRTKLDELPQLWNVLTGEMSLVGPRPCLPLQTSLIEARRRRGVEALRPGITGLAQVRGVDMSDPDALSVIDAQYLANRSFAGDLALIAKTLLGSGRGDRIAE